MMEMVVTTGATNMSTSSHSQHPVKSLLPTNRHASFYMPMPFLSPNQHSQST